jgi:uncharacterized protein
MKRPPSASRAACVALLVAFAAPAWPAAGQAMFNLAGDSASVKVTSLRDMPFKTVVRQQYDYSCGSAALATLLTHHYGRPSKEADIFASMYRAGDQEKIRRVGFSLLDMKRYLEGQGLKAEGYRWTLEDLKRASSPSIALIQVGNYRHFVIIKGVRDGRVLVGDPSAGLKLYGVADFGRIWNGVVFALAESPAGRLAYNRAEEWGHFTLGPMQPLEDTALASFTRELPPIFQIVSHRTGGGAIR